MTTLADLRRAAELLPPGALLTLTREALLDAFSGNGNGKGAAVEAPAAEPERLLSAKEVAERLGTSARWVYAHRASLPFAKELPGGSVRFSERGLNRWMERRT